jgi:hypothetical protein
MGVANKLFGVLVTAGGVEADRLQAELITAISINVAVTMVPRFERAICISSTHAKVSVIVAHPI